MLIFICNSSFHDDVPNQWLVLLSTFPNRPIACFGSTNHVKAAPLKKQSIWHFLQEIRSFWKTKKEQYISRMKAASTKFCTWSAKRNNPAKSERNSKGGRSKHKTLEEQNNKSDRKRKQGHTIRWKLTSNEPSRFMQEFAAWKKWRRLDKKTIFLQGNYDVLRRIANYSFNSLPISVELFQMNKNTLHQISIPWMKTEILQGTTISCL